MKYIVSVPEVWYQDVEIEADSPNEAVEKAKIPHENQAFGAFTYSHDLEESDAFIVKPKEY